MSGLITDRIVCTAPAMSSEKTFVIRHSTSSTRRRATFRQTLQRWHADGVSESLAIRLRGVVKRSGPITAVAGLDLDVPPGVCFGLLGPNGAGKSNDDAHAHRAGDPGRGRHRGARAARSPVESKQARDRRWGVVPQLDNLDVVA